MQAHDSWGWAKTNAVEKKYKTGKEKHGIEEEKRRDESRREKVQGRRGKDEETSGDAEQLLLASLIAVKSWEGSASSLSVLSPPRKRIR